MDILQYRNLFYLIEIGRTRVRLWYVSGFVILSNFWNFILSKWISPYLFFIKELQVRTYPFIVPSQDNLVTTIEIHTTFNLPNSIWDTDFSKKNLNNSIEWLCKLSLVRVGFVFCNFLSQPLSTNVALLLSKTY